MSKKFVLKCWDGDMYILAGYESQADIETILDGKDRARMPNGDMIKTSSIEKIQSYESYLFQSDQKMRHKKGQYIAPSGMWEDMNGEIASAHIEKITGVMTDIALPSGAKKLSRGE